MDKFTIKICQVLFSVSKTDFVSPSWLRAARSASGAITWFAVDAAAIGGGAKRTEPFAGVKRSSETPRTLPLPGEVRALRSEPLPFPLKVFFQHGSFRAERQTCRLSQKRRNNIITSVCWTRGQTRFTCLEGGKTGLTLPAWFSSLIKRLIVFWLLIMLPIKYGTELNVTGRAKEKKQFGCLAQISVIDPQTSDWS